LQAEVKPHSAFTVKTTMKIAKPAKPAAGSSPGTDAAAKDEKPQSADLGLAERRRFIRPLPVPDVVESDGDSDWATFQALSSEPPKD
jgi:hypothetical protein